MFIGEAPGELENKTGYAFVGVAGRILHKMLSYVHYQYQYLITNVVGCRPVTVSFLDSAHDKFLKDPDFSLSKYVRDVDYELTDWNREPTKSEMEACKPHIDELVESFKPHAIIQLGKIAKSYKTRLPTLELYHPAYIARLECKLLTVLKEARKIDQLLERLHESVKE